MDLPESRPGKSHGMNASPARQVRMCSNISPTKVSAMEPQTTGPLKCSDMLSLVLLALSSPTKEVKGPVILDH